jgi:MYXO-CTERM domain-containing protein
MKLRTSVSVSSLLGGLALAALSSSAEAHIRMVFPNPRHPGMGPPLKEAPCGVEGEKRSKIINTFKPGEKITVKWVEYISHPGHFRIAFLPDGDAFADPKSYTDIMKPEAPPILADGLYAHADGPDGKMYEQEITLPSTPCPNCTLQLIQMMTEKKPYGDGNDVYHECADIVLAGAASPGDGGTADASQDASSSTGGAGGGGSSTGGASGAGGSAPAGGTTGSGGSTTSSGGATGSGGSAGATGGSSGGSTGNGGSSSKGGSSGSGGSGPSDSGGGSSGCSITGAQKPGAMLGLLALMGLALVRGRRRR